MLKPKQEIEFIQSVSEAMNTPHTTDDLLNRLPDLFEKTFPFKRTAVYYRAQVGNVFSPYSLKLDQAKLPELNEECNIIESLNHRHDPILLDEKNNLHRDLFNRDSGQFLEKNDLNLIIPLRSHNYFRGMLITWLNPKKKKIIPTVARLANIAANIFIPSIEIKRIELSNDMNYYKLFKFDRLVLLGEMVASISHELKTPLSTIMLEIQEMNDCMYNREEMENSYRKISREIHKINKFVQSLLSFSRFQKISMESVPIKDFIEKTLGDIPRKKFPSDLKIVTDIDNSLTTMTDRSRLQQVFFNVLFNAVDALKVNGNIIIKTYKEYKDISKNDRIIISINDNGPGIPNEIKEKVFEPFFTTKKEGTGLGLYISYGIMKSLKGDLEIQSNETGTTVLIILPGN
jgi:signal transduction histidine kinase